MMCPMMDFSHFVTTSNVSLALFQVGKTLTGNFVYTTLESFDSWGTAVIRVRKSINHIRQSCLPMNTLNVFFTMQRLNLARCCLTVVPYHIVKGTTDAAFSGCYLTL